MTIVEAEIGLAHGVSDEVMDGQVMMVVEGEGGGGSGSGDEVEKGRRERVRGSERGGRRRRDADARMCKTTTPL